MKMKYATFGERVNAYVIDTLLLMGVSIFVFIGVFLFQIITTDSDGIPEINDVLINVMIVMALVSYAYFTYMIGKYGYTVGKKYCDMKVVTYEGRKPGYPRALLRTFGYSISSAFFYLGFLWIAVDKKKQGWHDKIAKTYVIRDVRK